MLLNQTESDKTEQRAQDWRALSRRLHRPSVEAPVEVTQAQPTSYRSVIALVAFVSVVLLMCCSVIFYHEQQRTVRAQYDANQKRLLAEYRRNESWRPAAIALETSISKDLEAIEFLRVGNEADFKELKRLVGKVDSALASAPPVPTGLAGPGATYRITRSSFRSILNNWYRQEGCAFMLDTDKDARKTAESILARYNYSVFYEESAQSNHPWMVSEEQDQRKRNEFRWQAHQLSNAELKRQVIALGSQVPATGIVDLIERLLNAKPYVPDGLDVEYAEKLP